MPFFVFVEHEKNTKDINMLKLINPKVSADFFKFPSKKKILFTISLVAGKWHKDDYGQYIVESVNVDLYMNHMSRAYLPGDIVSRMNKQFVPWNVGFTIKNFIKNATKAQESNHTTNTSGTQRVTFKSTTFKPSIDLVYDTFIDTENIPKEKWHAKKNDALDIFEYLRHIWWYKLFIYDIRSIYATNGDAIQLTFPIHHMLNLMCQIHYDQDVNVQQYKSYIYTQTDVSLDKLAIPYFRSRELVWKDYQFVAPDFLLNSIAGSEKLKNYNDPYPLSRVEPFTSFVKKLDTDKGGSNFWILPSQAITVTPKSIENVVSTWLTLKNVGKDKNFKKLNYITPPPRIAEDVSYLMENIENLKKRPDKVTDPVIDLLFYVEEVDSIFSNDKRIPLHTTVSLKRKRSETDDDYKKYKISSKSYLSQHTLKTLNVYTSTESAHHLVQVDSKGNIISDWNNSLPIRNLKLTIYEPKKMSTNRRYKVILNRDVNALDHEINPYSFKMSPDNINSLLNLTKGKTKLLATLAVINNLSTAITNFKPHDKNVWITCEGVVHSEMFTNGKIIPSVIKYFDLAPYLTAGDTSVNINFENDFNPQFDGKYKTFILNDVEDLYNLEIAFLNSDMEPLKFDEKTLFNNPALTFHFQVTK